MLVLRSVPKALLCMEVCSLDPPTLKMWHNVWCLFRTLLLARSAMVHKTPDP